MSFLSHIISFQRFPPVTLQKVKSHLRDRQKHRKGAMANLPYHLVVQARVPFPLARIPKQAEPMQELLLSKLHKLMQMEVQFIVL